MFEVKTLFKTYVLWLLVILPWFTLFFMKKEEVRRFLPVGLFAALTSLVIADVGSTLNLWILRENVYPFGTLFPYHLGASIVITMWLFKWAYGRFIRYLGLDAVFNLANAFLLLPWLAVLGIRENLAISYTGILVINTLHGILLYGFQVLYEGLPVRDPLISLQPAAAKPYQEERLRED